MGRPADGHLRAHLGEDAAEHLLSAHQVRTPLEVRQQLPEAAELVAFLRTLTDESSRPERPKSVPSGLPVASPRLERMGEEPIQ